MKPDKENKPLNPQDSENKSDQQSDTPAKEDIEEFTNILPDDEMVEEIQNLPPEVKKSLSMFFSMGRISSGSPISKYINSEHIGKIIDSSDKDSERAYQKFKSSEITKRYAIAAILALVLMVLLYAGITKDQQLSEKIITAGISALGGFGAGYAVAKQNK